MPSSEFSKYLTQIHMQQWIIAFTHESYDSKFNYETIELLGDKILGSSLMKYLLKAHPGYTNAEYTELIRACVETYANGARAVNHNMDKYVRIVRRYGSAVPQSVYGDVFEAFIGALYNVSEGVNAGLGSLNCDNMITSIFNGETIPLEERFGTSKTIVQQIFGRLGAGKLTERIEGSGGDDPKVNVILSISPDMAEKINARLAIAYGGKDKGPRVVAGVIGKSSLLSKKASSQEAYNMARDTLKSFGITREVAFGVKTGIDISDPDLDRRVRERMKFMEGKTEPVADIMAKKVMSLGVPHRAIEFVNSRKLTGLNKGAQEFVISIMLRLQSGESVRLSMGYGSSAEIAKADAVVNFLQDSTSSR